MKARLHALWIVLPYQHGRLDDCEAARAFATEAEAMEAAKLWAEEVPYNPCEHEAVVFKAVASFRGKRTVAKYEVTKNVTGHAGKSGERK